MKRAPRALETAKHSQSQERHLLSPSEFRATPETSIHIQVLILSWTVPVDGGCVAARDFSQVPRARARFPAGVGESIGSWSARPRARLQIAGLLETVRGRSRGVRRFGCPGPGRPGRIAGLLETPGGRSRGVPRSEQIRSGSRDSSRRPGVDRGEHRSLEGAARPGVLKSRDALRSFYCCCGVWASRSADSTMRHEPSQ